MEPPPPLRLTASLPVMDSSPLYPEVGRARDIAQPGGFRRDHVQRFGRPDAAACRPLLASVTDPRVRLFLEPPGEEGEPRGLVAVPPNGSSDMATILVLLKSTVGGTLIVIPGGFMGAGLCLASLLLVVMGVVEIYCMVLLVRCSRQLGGGSYGDVAAAALGRVGSLAVDVSLVLSQIGFVCAEMLYVGKNTHGAFQALDWRPQLSVTHLLVLQLVLVVPMSWIRRLQYFQVSNLIANVTVLVALAVLLGYAAVGLHQDGAGPNIQSLGPRWMLFAGTAVFSFECINFVIPMYEAHERKETFVPILTGTLLVVVVLFVVFGGVNYIRYGDTTDQVVTLNLPKDSLAGKVMPLAFALASLCNVPLFLFPASTLIEGKLFIPGPPTFWRKWQKNFLRTLLLSVCCGISVVGADSVEALVSIIGSVCCVPLAFIYPTIFHAKLCNPGRACVVFDYAIAALGVVLFFVTTATAIQSW